MENKTVYINFFDGIDAIKANRFIQFTADAINKYHPDEIYLLMASNGGDVDSGFVLYNFLISLQASHRITTHNIGTIDSIANVIFLGGQNRFAAPNTSFLFHGVSMNFAGPQSRRQIKESLSRIEGMENRIAQTISKHSKLSEDEITSFLEQGDSKDVNFALSKGIIQEIKIPVIPKDATHLVMNFA